MSICEATKLDPRAERRNEAVRCELPHGHVGRHRCSFPQPPHPPMVFSWEDRKTIGQLPAKWRARAEGVAELDETYWRALRECADELDEALKVTGENIIATFKALGDAL